MAKSLPPVSAKVIADAEQFINEFKRADNAARRSAASIDKEVGTLTKKIGDKFKLADFGKDVLKGAGLFGGFDIARTAAEAVAGYYKDAADHAKLIEESSARQLANTLAMIKEKQSPQAQVAFLSRDIASEQARLAQFQDEKLRSFSVFDERGNQRTLVGDLTNAQKEEMARITETIQTLTIERNKLVASIEAQTAAEQEAAKVAGETDRKSDQERRIKALSEGLKNQETAFEADLAAKSKANEATAKLREENEKLAETYRRISDPTLKFTSQMAEANRLADEGKITFLEAARAVDELTRAMEHDKAARIDNALNDFFGDMDSESKLFRKAEKTSLEIERIVGRAADGMADAWVDSLKGVEGAWSNLADSIITEILRVAAQILIVKPMINGLGGILSGFGGGGGILGTLGAAFSDYGGPKASGGGVEGGYSYRVNENGQEFFRPNVGGTVIPLGASGGLRGEGGGSVTINQSYQIGAGVTAAQLMPILAMQKRDLLATIADHKRRRTSFGAALA